MGFYYDAGHLGIHGGFSLILLLFINKVQVLRLNVKLCYKRDVFYHPAGIAIIKLIEQ